MKPILMILGLILAVGAGAVGGIMAVPRAAQPKADAYVDTRPSTSPAPSQNPELEKRLQSLSLEISGLQTELAALRESRTRAPASATETNPSNDKLAQAAESPEVFAAVHRDAILKVLADERAAQDKKREDERKDRELKANEAKADRAAQKFNLSAGQRSTLVQYYTDEQAHIDEMRADFRNGQQQGGDPTAVREAFRAGREWRANELTRLFGTDLGGQLNEFENEGRGRMAGGGGGGGGNGGGGQRRAGAQNGGNAGQGAPPQAPGGGNN